jgi:hypothetical protein
MKVSECSVCITVVVVSVILLIVLGYFSTPMLLASAGAGIITYSFSNSWTNSTIAAIVALFGMALLTKYGILNKEGFNVHTPPTEISNSLRNMKNEYRSNVRKVPEISYDDSFQEDDVEDGFINQVFKNITTAGYTSPGFGVGAPLVEGFEDNSPTKKEATPAPTLKKEELALPFKLGEIPSQVKNGPHIDAGSTLIKAIQGLNPDQINAMTKDTKQLIETQKSLMSMLGTMKPMMNDGKELMETFQQMFGQ